MIKTRFERKWHNLVCNHDGFTFRPFAGRHTVRWAIVDITQISRPCVYEGKPSRQAIELMLSQPKSQFYVLIFDRTSVLYVQHVDYARISRFAYTSIDAAWRHYFPGHNFLTATAKFWRPERGIQR